MARSDPATAAQLAHGHADLWLSQSGHVLYVELSQLVVVLVPAGQRSRLRPTEAVGHKQFHNLGFGLHFLISLPSTKWYTVGGDWSYRL